MGQVLHGSAPTNQAARRNLLPATTTLAFQPLGQPCEPFRCKRRGEHRRRECRLSGLSDFTELLSRSSPSSLETLTRRHTTGGWNRLDTVSFKWFLG
jgi:hypothetical protein